ncbi:MAG: hypothetical protein ACF8R7_12170 [Phycisphaerales bacterium JB039]
MKRLQISEAWARRSLPDADDLRWASDALVEGEPDPAPQRPSDVRVVCLFDVPLVCNDGRRVDRRIIAAIEAALDDRYGGCNVRDGVRRGRWHGAEEPVLRIEVAVSAAQVGEVRRLAIAMGCRLQQEAVYFVADGVAEIIPLR